MSSPLSPKQLVPLLPDFSGANCWVAYSGGLDSSVLLHLLASLRDQLGLQHRLKAIHINHQISPNAKAWAQHANQVCDTLSVPLVVELVDVVNDGQGIEEAARKARYQVFEKYLESGDWLLMAHHADDQAETLLLRLLRGTGPKGLAGMPLHRTLGKGQLHRPLLSFTRQTLEAYAAAHQLTWVEDESNQADTYDRNYLRNQVMPLLKARWPQASERFVDAAKLVADQQQLWALNIREQLESMRDCGPWGASLNLSRLLKLSPYHRAEIIREWAAISGLDIPEAKHLHQLERQLLHLQPDAELRIDWGRASLRLSQGRLYLLRLADNDVFFHQTIALEADDLVVPLPNGASLQFKYCDDPDTTKLSAGGTLTITPRSTGDKCKPNNRRHSQTLKKLFQELNVPAWVREHLPVIRRDEQILAVGGLFICQGFETKGKGYKIIYTPPQAFH